MSQLKPFAGSADNELIGGHGHVVRVVAFLRDNVGASAIAGDNFIGLSPGSEADEMDIVEAVGDGMKV
jgi:hypothetical protein